MFLLLAVSAVFTYFALSHASGFADVPQSYWAYASINEASTDGVINGVGSNKFAPNGNVTLAQFTAILTRMMYPAEVEASTATGEWWAKNVNVAENNNFFEYLANTDMTHALTREEMAHIIYNAYPDRDDAAFDEVLNKIPDAASLSSAYKYSVAFCYAKGILQGVDKAGNFSPKATLTRTQTAAVYVRLKTALSGNAPAVTETSVETPAAMDTRDLNEWGIPHFRMLDGENVQQMMDRINAATPAYREGYLTNGKPISEANIREMVDAVLKDMPEGGIWNEDAKYYYTSPACGSYGACGAYAYAVSDYIFGEDAPATKRNNYESIKAGDIERRVTDGTGHVIFIAGDPNKDTTEIYTSEDGVNFTPKYFRMVKIIDANNNGKIGGIQDSSVVNVNNNKHLVSDYVISRY